MEQKMLPEHGSKKFKCPHCSIVATQEWFNGYNAGNAVISIFQHIYLNYRQGIQDYDQKSISDFLNSSKHEFKETFNRFVPNSFSIATCCSCSEITLWINEQIVYPKRTTIPPPNEDLDEDIKALYIEASQILVDSPKGSTALLRLALQKLLKQVGKSGKNINNDIKELVAEGLNSTVQQALDLLRVIGNNAVHPGQIDLDDDTSIAHGLFNILNFIADELITKPKELEDLYNRLIPLETQEHIKQRDKKK